MRKLVLVFASSLAIVVGCAGESTPGRMNIAVIPKGTSHAFWQSIHAGARKAAKELDVDITWRGPLREDDRDSQVAEVENAVARRVSGIVLAPLDEAALVAPVMSARRSGVPVVIFDSGLKGGEFVSFVATDNDKGGEMAGDHLGTAIGGRGKAILLRYAEGHDSTTRREEGFLRGLKAHPQIEVVSSNQFLGADVEGAYKRAEAILTKYKASDGSLGIDGIFAPNESTAFAVMRVLQDSGWAGKVKFIGFDASDGLIAGLRSGASVAVNRSKIIIYTAGALFAGVAGVLQFARLSVGDPTVADGLELDVIAAVIIGGGSLSGGRGTVFGTLLGATTMAVIQIGCAQKGYPNWVQQIVTGAIIVLAVALDRWRQGKQVG